MRSLILTALAIFLIGYGISMINKSASSSRYQRKPKDQWNRLNEGDDPTDPQDEIYG
jgi:hypothetical protein